MAEENVHKDFHGALSYGFIHLSENYGEQALFDYLERLARSIYKPLIDSMRADGLEALRRHWDKIMTLEEADYSIGWEGGELVLNVRRCPALEHIRARGYPESPLFCEQTRIINKIICDSAGFESETVFDRENASCVQRFRKKRSTK